MSQREVHPPRDTKVDLLKQIIEMPLDDERRLQNFQAGAKGLLTRLRLGLMMRSLRDSEDHLIQLQSISRGNWTRDALKNETFMHEYANKLQPTPKGFFAYSRLGNLLDWTRDAEPRVEAGKIRIR